jgi:hypothetical protein
MDRDVGALRRETQRYGASQAFARASDHRDAVQERGGHRIETLTQILRAPVFDAYVAP